MSTLLAEARQFDRDLAQITERAGQAATIRRYISQSGGTPWAGTQGTPTVSERRVRLLNARPVTVRELQESGGRLTDGDLVVWLQGDLALQDRVQIEGVEWQVATEPHEQHLHGRRAISAVLRRQGQ